MSAIDLGAIPTVGVTPVPVDSGRILKPALNAPTQRIDRLGNKNLVQIETGSIKEGPTAMYWRARLAQARRLGAAFPWPQPGIVNLASDGIIATPTLVGRVLPISGLQPYTDILFGQAVSVIVDGQRYLDFAEDQVTAGDDGKVMLPIRNLIRAPMAAGSVVELVRPMIEGTIEGDIGGPFGMDGKTSFSFTITEDA